MEKIELTVTQFDDDGNVVSSYVEEAVVIEFAEDLKQLFNDLEDIS